MGGWWLVACWIILSALGNSIPISIHIPRSLTIMPDNCVMLVMWSLMTQCGAASHSINE